MKATTISLLAGLAIAATSVTALAETPDQMRDKCRNYAARHLKIDAGLINVQYEGQRTDKTHAVNGDAEGAHPVTFQCNFRSGGHKIYQFVVNTPDHCPPDISEADRWRYPNCD